MPRRRRDRRVRDAAERSRIDNGKLIDLAVAVIDVHCPATTAAVAASYALTFTRAPTARRIPAVAAGHASSRAARRRLRGEAPLREVFGRDQARGRQRSVKRAGRENEARRCSRARAAAGVKTRSVQPVPTRCLGHGLGLAAVGDDPCHDRVKVSALGDDRGPLDDGPARGMIPGESSDHGSDRFIVHGSTVEVSTCSPLAERAASRHAVPARARRRAPLPLMGPNLHRTYRCASERPRRRQPLGNALTTCAGRSARVASSGMPVTTARWSLSARCGPAWRTQLLLLARQRKAREA
jgi:hypothetical protein